MMKSKRFSRIKRKLSFLKVRKMRKQNRKKTRKEIENKKLS